MILSSKSAAVASSIISYETFIKLKSNEFLNSTSKLPVAVVEVGLLKPNIST
jgi:hypothetical protein